VHFRVVPVIGPLFLLDFIGSFVVAAVLLAAYLATLARARP